MPSRALVIPCELRARLPSGAVSLKPVTCPVRGSTLARVRKSFGTESVIPDVAVVVDRGIVHPAAAAHPRGNAFRPLAPVDGGELRRQLRDGDVVLRDHVARGLTRRARLQVEIQGRRFGAAGAGEIRGQLVAVVLDGDRRPAVATAPAVVADVRHQIDHGAPAALVEPVLQHQAGLVTFRARDAEHLFQPPILTRLGGQGVQPLHARQLVREVGGSREREVLRHALRGVENHMGARAVEADRLRPDAVASAVERRGERRKVVSAGVVGEDRGRDRRALRLRGRRPRLASVRRPGR